MRVVPGDTGLSIVYELKNRGEVVRTAKRGADNSMHDKQVQQLFARFLVVADL